jgi:hypothetical protein
LADPRQNLGRYPAFWALTVVKKLNFRSPQAGIPIEHHDGAGQGVERHAGEARDSAGLAARNLMDAGLKVIISDSVIVLWLYCQ